MKINFRDKNGLVGTDFIDLIAFIGSLFGRPETVQGAHFYWQCEGIDDMEGSQVILNLGLEYPVMKIYMGLDKDKSIENKCYTLLGYCQSHKISCMIE